MTVSQEDASQQLLTTGEAAKLLGTSRQHVVDLCTSGRLRYQMVGTHRRVLRSDVEAVQHRHVDPVHNPEKSLWLHRAVAGKLALNPDAVLSRARRNLARLREVHSRGNVQVQFDQWQTLLDGPIDSLLDFLVSRSPKAVEMRQNTPFAGVLTEAERAKALKAFRQTPRVA